MFSCCMMLYVYWHVLWSYDQEQFGFMHQIPKHTPIHGVDFRFEFDCLFSTRATPKSESFPRDLVVSGEAHLRKHIKDIHLHVSLPGICVYYCILLYYCYRVSLGFVVESC